MTTLSKGEAQVDTLFRFAVDQHRIGKIDEADRLYGEVLELSPEHAPASHNRGLIAFKRGQIDQALSHYRDATRSAPAKEQFWHSLIDTLLTANRFDEAEQALAEAQAAGHGGASFKALADKVGDLLAEARRAADMTGEDADLAGYSQRLIEIFNQGKFAEAELSARQAVSSHPDFGLGWKLLGVAQQIQGKPAVLAMRRATELLPDDPDTHLNLGATLLAEGAFAAAEEAFRRALAIDGGIAEGHANLAFALERQGRHQEAGDAYRQAAQLAPDDQEAQLRYARNRRACGETAAAVDAYQRARSLAPLAADALIGLANCLAESGDYAQSFDIFEKALALPERDAETHRMYGDALFAADRFSDAEAQYRNALLLKPDLFSAQLNLGTCLDRQGKTEDAIRAFRRASQIDRTSPLTHANQSASHFRLREFEAAISEARQAIKLDPSLPAAHLNLGSALMETKDYPAAMASFRVALQLRPDYFRACQNIAEILVEYGEAEAGIDYFRRAIELGGTSATLLQNLIFAHHYLPNGGAPADHRKLTGQYAATVRATSQAYQDWPRPPAHGTKIRVGLVSGDLHQHPVGMFLEGAIRDFEAPDIELIAYYNHDRQDALNDRLRALVAGWRDIAALADDEVIELIRQDEIDILVDMAGHSARNRLPLFARRPAPIQATWLGYFATTGLEEIDYFITDGRVFPEGTEGDFVERPKRLPDCFLCLSPPAFDVALAAPPAVLGAPFTFGCFNFAAKINVKVIAAWSAILAATADSRLYLKSRQLAFAPAVDRIVSEFRQNGIDESRLIIEGASPHLDYYAAYNRVDLCLDPFPYTGGTTTIDALWMGVPTLTQRGNSLIGRQGESILTTAGLPEFVVADTDAYIAQAIEWASHPDRLVPIRERLRNQLLASALCDSRKYGAALATIFREMWDERGRARCRAAN